MKAHLMYPDRDFDLAPEAPADEPAAVRDLGLRTLWEAMANGDDLLFRVAEQSFLSAVRETGATIRYRQDVLKDCLRNPIIATDIYALATETLEYKRRMWLGIFGFGKSPSGILSSSVRLMDMLVDALARLRDLVERQTPTVESEGLRQLRASVTSELTDTYLAGIRRHLKELTFPEGVLVSAGLGEGNRSSNHVLRRFPDQHPTLAQRLFHRGPPAYSFRLDERDDIGSRTLAEMVNQGIDDTANLLAESADHVLSFFVKLRVEMAFYLGCVNLHRRLSARAIPVCFPLALAANARKHVCTGLREPCLALTTEGPIVGNDLDADDASLFVITGANQGGKTTFLRAIGVAQIMMQAGMFVTAEAYVANICPAVLTHFKREEDVEMASGKLDEELRRMSDIVDQIAPYSLLLCNESFAATNEREGAAIARDIVRTLMDARIKIFFVTHLHEFAHGLLRDRVANVVFLRAERQEGGTRSFKLRPGEPLQTSFGADLYDSVFAGNPLSVAGARPRSGRITKEGT